MRGILPKFRLHREVSPDFEDSLERWVESCEPFPDGTQT
jgi:hypothetical protein